MQVNISTSTKVALFFCGALMSGSVFAENVIPKGASKLPSLEFGALVKTYMIDSNSKSSWNFSTNSQNILWNSNIKWNAHNKKYEKDGFVRLQFDGFKLKEDTYNNPKKVRPEAAWNINYSGKNKSKVTQINIEHLLGGRISDYDEANFRPFNSLMKNNIAYYPLCSHNWDSPSKVIGYKLISTNNKSVFMMVMDSAGASGGHSRSYDLFLTKAEMLNSFYELTGTNAISANCTTLPV